MVGILATLLLQPAWVERPFNGKDLTGWVAKPRSGASAWRAGKAQLDPADPSKFLSGTTGKDLINDTLGYGKSWDLYTESLYGDCHIAVEVMVPKGSNSGIYVMGEYEVQVLDSFGSQANPQPHDLGALYGAQPPKNPKYLPAGTWNRINIFFTAPRFDASGKKTANAKFHRVVLNGGVIHEGVEMPGPTPAGVDGKEKPLGPLMLQGDHGPVAYRGLRIRKWSPQS
jgi:hypothetical protein